MIQHSNYIEHIGRIAILGAFLYFGIDSILNPQVYTGLIPEFLSSIINPVVIVSIHGMIEVICALLLIFKLGGKWPWYILFLSFLGVLGSVSGTTLVRDIGILGGLLLIRPR